MNEMDKISLKIKLLFVLPTILFGCGRITDKNKEKEVVRPQVSIVLPSTNDSFEELKHGIIDVLDGTFKIQYFSAEGDATKFETVIQSSLLNSPKYLVTVGTQITSTAFGAKFKDQLPTVIAGAISSPEAIEELVNVGIEPPRNSQVAIVSDNPRESIYLLFSQAILDFLPDVKKVGILYNPAEINSKETAFNIIKSLNNNNLTVIEGVINDAEDIEKVTDRLILKGSQAIIIPHDKKAVSKASSIVKKCDSKNIPVLSLDDGTVKKAGVSIGISVNYRIIGELIGHTILKIEDNETKASEMPIATVESAKIYINKKKIDDFGIKIPESLIKYLEIIK